MDLAIPLLPTPGPRVKKIIFNFSLVRIYMIVFYNSLINVCRPTNGSNVTLGEVKGQEVCTVLSSCSLLNKRIRPSVRNVTFLNHLSGF